jgi:hypothetical protein
MSSAQAASEGSAPLAETAEEESGVNVKADPEAVAAFNRRIENAHPKWKKLIAEIERLYP